MQRGLFLDLRDRLLRPRGLILLSHFQFYYEPMTLRADRRISLIWELTDVNVKDWTNPDTWRWTCGMSGCEEPAQ
jgi:hypothetical protein